MWEISSVLFAWVAQFCHQSTTIICCCVAAGDNRKYVNESWKFINARLFFCVCWVLVCMALKILHFLSFLKFHMNFTMRVWLATSNFFSAELSAHLIVAWYRLSLWVNFKDNGHTFYRNKSLIFTQVLIHRRRATISQLIFNLQTDRTRGSVSRASVKW